MFLLLSIIILLCVGFGVLYQFFGLKYYLRAVSYVRKNPSVSDTLYGLNKNEAYGGILAGAWSSGAGIWGRSGLRFFRYTKVSSQVFTYTTFLGCKEKQMKKALYDNPNDWQANLRPGDYVIVTYNKNSKSHINTALGSDFWFFMDSEAQFACMR